MRRVSRSFHVCTLRGLIASGIAPAIGVWKEQQPQSTRQVGRCVVDEFSSASIENARTRTAELVPAGSFTNLGNQNAPASTRSLCPLSKKGSRQRQCSTDDTANFVCQ